MVMRMASLQFIQVRIRIAYKAPYAENACPIFKHPSRLRSLSHSPQGVDEPSVPDVKLTRSRDGGSGTATFIFDNPSIFEASGELGDVTGLYMVDSEGTLNTVEVSAKFVNGKPSRIEAKYVMRTSFEWDRFLRFMERYAEKVRRGGRKLFETSSAFIGI